MTKFILTFTPIFKKNVIRELESIDTHVIIGTSFDATTMLIETSLEKTKFIKACLDKSLIFIKHMMPVDKVETITYKKDKDIELLIKSLNEYIKLNKNDKFAVQCRIKNIGYIKADYNSKDIEVALGMHFEKEGAVATFSDNKIINEDIHVISIFIYDNNAYIGYSTSKENLNFHCDEHRIASREGREISRAENKLKEAIAKFNIKLSGEGYALDVGAAPGGWTKVLSDYGYNVIAVDPGDLKEELYKNSKIKHIKCRIEDLTFENYFDVIVNDMNVDPEITANIMNNLVKTLKKGGLAVVTFKLSNVSKSMEDIEKASKILSKNYKVLMVKSLFHNRQEVTALLENKTK